MQAQTGLEKTEQSIIKTTSAPFIVEAEKLFDKMKEISQNIAYRAYELFKAREPKTSEPLDDWFRAESELLRPLPVQIKETNNQFVVRAEVPGFKAEDIEVSVEPRLLMISGKATSDHESKVEDETEQTVFNECRSRQFFRSFELPCEVEAPTALATLKDGMLELTLNKLEKTNPLKVEVTPA